MTFEEWYSTQRHQLSNEQVCRVIWNAATKAEREACAMMFDDSPHAEHFRSDIAAAIRSRHCVSLKFNRSPGGSELSTARGYPSLRLTSMINMLRSPMLGGLYPSIRHETGYAMKTYSADEVARYLIAKFALADDRISNLKLQKLCYYAQGLTLGVRKEPLFPEAVEAWAHGPVVPALYHKYKAYGGAAIDPVEDLDVSIYAPEDQLILNDVVEYYGQYSAWKLREMTHAESPWSNNYGEFGGRVIPQSELIEFFSAEVSDEYRNKYEQVSKESRTIPV